MLRVQLIGNFMLRHSGPELNGSEFEYLINERT